MGLGTLRADVKRLLAGVRDLRAAFTETETCSEEESARWHCLTWRTIAHRWPGDDLAAGMAVVREFEAITEPTPAETRHYLRLLYECWNNLDPDRGLPYHDIPPELPEDA
jgi:hypothetical protein